MADTTFEQAAQELYGLAPTDFIAARNVLAAAASDRQTAAQIRGLRKPPTSVWVVNLLSRRTPTEVGALSTLAAELRGAQDDRDASRLTALNKDRRMLVAELVRAAASLAEHEGVSVGAGVLDEVERTLGAAARDEAAAAAVRTGRLLRPLEASGVDPVDLTEAVAGEAPALPEPAPGRDDLSERRARHAAERAAQAARREMADAEREAARTETRLAAARERETLLRERLDALESELARVRVDAEVAAAEREEAERAVGRSAERRRAAQLAEKRAAHGALIDPGPSVET